MVFESIADLRGKYGTQKNTMKLIKAAVESCQNKTNQKLVRKVVKFVVKLKSEAACRIIVSSPVPVPFLSTLDFGFGTRIWDLDLGLGFGTWIWDLDLGLDLGLTIHRGHCE